MASVTGVTDISGCFDTTTNSCYFTPRLQVMDNWGWCTGECRADNTNGVLGDVSSSKILHPYGGCYAGANPDPEEVSDTGEVRLNTNLTRELLDVNEDGPAFIRNECSIVSGSPTARPWVVYPGAVQLRPGN
ncbi:MAG: hypothetical protein H6759_03610 [Candidatus Nomurabacteria bacterium]|nr:MAG: hypothetical protein H6759_03610 [Candidatus Nomurabacteria bacterium]